MRWRIHNWTLAWLIWGSVTPGCHHLRPCWPPLCLPAPTTADPTPGPPRPAVLPASATEVVPSPPAEPVSQEGQQEGQTASHGNSQPFRIPRELPGSNAPPLRLPPLDASRTPQERRSLVQSLFPDLPQLNTTSPPAAADSLELTQLQQIALENSPVISQAIAEVRKARGLAVQAGLYPNPTVGYEGDTVGTARTLGYNGVFASQEFITAGKLTLAQNAALMDVRAAEHAARRARINLASDVRRNYFKVLVAQEQLVFNRAMTQLAEAVYRAQIDLVAGGEAAAYEPLQLRVLAIQARNSTIQAQNGLTAAWRQLAASLGTPDMPYPGVNGSVEGIAPHINYEAARAWMLSRHTDLAIAQAMIAKSGHNLRLQQVTPIPNLQVYSALQKDDTTTLNDMSFNLQVGLPIPVFDRNQGNIATAFGEVQRSNQDLINQRNQLVASLSEAYGRYASSTEIARTYRSDILADQVRVYRGVYDRFRGAGESVEFAQVVVAQQTLAQVVTSYLQTLSDQWIAVVDLAQLLQVDDLYSMQELFPDPPAVPLPEAPQP